MVPSLLILSNKMEGQRSMGRMIQVFKVYLYQKDLVSVVMKYGYKLWLRIIGLVGVSHQMAVLHIQHLGELSSKV